MTESTGSKPRETASAAPQASSTPVPRRNDGDSVGSAAVGGRALGVGEAGSHEPRPSAAGSREAHLSEAGDHDARFSAAGSREAQLSAAGGNQAQLSEAGGREAQLSAAGRNETGSAAFTERETVSAVEDWPDGEAAFAWAAEASTTAWLSEDAEDFAANQGGFDDEDEDNDENANNDNDNDNDAFPPALDTIRDAYRDAARDAHRGAGLDTRANAGTHDAGARPGASATARAPLGAGEGEDTGEGAARAVPGLAIDRPEHWLAVGFARQVRGWSRASGAPEEAQRAVARAALMLCERAAEGQVCVPLAAVPFEAAGPADPTQTREWLLQSGVVGEGSDAYTPARLPVSAGEATAASSPLAPLPPLVIDAQGRLYLHRYFDLEQRLARRVLALRGARPALSDWGRDGLPRLVQALFAGNAAALAGETDAQRVAVALALAQGLAVVSGGPGTGKTTLVLNLLACLLADNPNCRIAMAAPTGKAAARMGEAIAGGVAALGERLSTAALQEADRTRAGEALERLPREAKTVHRLLGADAQGRMRYGRSRRLPVDVLVVDEASMLDLALAARLLEAVPDGARVVLLGDKDQLAAVEAGSVFADLCADPRLSEETGARVAALAGLPVQALVPPPAQRAQPTSPALPDSTVWLTRNWRFAATSRIGQLARRIAAGEADELLPWLAQPDPTGELRWLVQPGRPVARGRQAPADERFEAESGALFDRASDQPSDAAFDAASGASSDAAFDASSGSTSDAASSEAFDALSIRASDAPADRASDAPTDRASDASSSEASGVASERGERSPSTRSADGVGDVDEVHGTSTPVEAALEAWAGYVARLAQGESDPQALFSALARHRVLCAVREGPCGAVTINRAVAARVAAISARPGGAGGTRYATGQAVLVLRNDRALDLFNGDIGVAAPDESGQPRVWFPARGGGLRPIAPARLPPHEAAFAMTVHKSQGSEFESVLVVLPDTPSPVLTRELLYTAVTRARRSVMLVASESAVREAVGRRSERGGGLTDRVSGRLR